MARGGVEVFMVAWIHFVIHHHSDLKWCWLLSPKRDRRQKTKVQRRDGSIGPRTFFLSADLYLGTVKKSLSLAFRTEDNFISR